MTNSCPVDRFSHLICGSLELLYSDNGPFIFFNDYSFHLSCQLWCTSCGHFLVGFQLGQTFSINGRWISLNSVRCRELFYLSYNLTLLYTYRLCFMMLFDLTFSNKPLMPSQNSCSYVTRHWWTNTVCYDVRNVGWGK